MATNNRTTGNQDGSMLRYEVSGASGWWDIVSVYAVLLL
eukprot:CAMPEP_0176084836 /NCGR_PEP_ID=MMETSP0120_2-20121206/42457_1 /TAXON_ID=160619 /ORGANISM="Kryptoperidinium foliaceum, Strain CCMP 1326" /LENGTH=38 /DNA_ID= /DNA_START= /DNA_END= /DNA_ORIENTATION=